MENFTVGLQLSKTEKPENVVLELEVTIPEKGQKKVFLATGVSKDNNILEASSTIKVSCFKHSATALVFY